jgi:methyl-accepting chemotaxis protein
VAAGILNNLIRDVKKLVKNLGGNPENSVQEQLARAFQHAVEQTHQDLQHFTNKVAEFERWSEGLERRAEKLEEMARQLDASRPGATQASAQTKQLTSRVKSATRKLGSAKETLAR